MSNQRTYGDSVAYSFKLTTPPRLVTHSLDGSQIAVNKLHIGPSQFGSSSPIPAEDTFIVTIHMVALPDNELLNYGKSYIRQGYKRYGMRITNLQGEFSAKITNAHEVVDFYVPRQALDNFTDEAGLRRIRHLRCAPGIIDPVMSSLADALFNALHRPHEVSQLFADHLILAATAHLVTHYSEDIALPRTFLTKGGLSPRQVSRAQTFLATHFADDIALSDVASHCGLSRAHFTRVFRKATGLTPHQWLSQYRVEQAMARILEAEATVESVALACGFADRNHLTRVFTRHVGVSPETWRRENRSRPYQGCRRGLKDDQSRA